MLYNLPYRWFIGLAIDDEVRDHSGSDLPCVTATGRLPNIEIGAGAWCACCLRA
jgi:hypothetical protein